MAKRTTEPKGELRDIEVEKLHLDPENPRLPETLQNAKENDILAYMVRDEALTELAESFADNGFFRHEPLLVIEREALGTFHVIEGNRRLATLLVLLNRPVAKGLSLGLDLSAERKKELLTAPCRVLQTREEVEPYVGYRHIGGMKRWPAEAKARYVVDQIDKLVKKKDPEPFKTLGRRVGSNARPMRHSYVTLRLLRHARDEGKFNLQALLDERRFGVWLRAYDSPAIRRYIGFEGDSGEPTTYKDVQAAFRKVNLKRLLEVLEDLVPYGDAPPIMDDSRDMSVYAAVLTNERAREVMRKRRSLDEARLLVTDETLPSKIERLARAAEDLLADVVKTKANDELSAAAGRLWEAAKALRAGATKKVDE
jgi:hypothetical protein